MELSELINLIEKDSINIGSIHVPKICTSYGTFKDIDFLNMGVAKSSENYGKTIFLSKNAIFEKSLDDMGFNGDFGSSKLGEELSESLDKEVFSITGLHLKEYIRTYDKETHKEKVFFPLESEVFEDAKCSRDAETFNKYPIWDGFSRDSSMRIKYFSGTPHWWALANKSFPKSYCSVSYSGYSSFAGTPFSLNGVVFAFCI